MSVARTCTIFVAILLAACENATAQESSARGEGYYCYQTREQAAANAKSDAVAQAGWECAQRGKSARVKRFGKPIDRPDECRVMFEVLFDCGE